MTPGDNEAVCSCAEKCIRHGIGALSDFPRLIQKIIENKAWESRIIKGGTLVEFKSLAELITTAPLEGWGEDIAKVEALLKDSPEVLPMFRDAMKMKPGPKVDSSLNNVKETIGGNDKSYTLSRLKRESPELFKSVCDGELSANAAAIKSGFRRKTATFNCEDVSKAVASLLKHYTRKEIRNAMAETTESR